MSFESMQGGKNEKLDTRTMIRRAMGVIGISALTAGAVTSQDAEKGRQAELAVEDAMTEVVDQGGSELPKTAKEELAKKLQTTGLTPEAAASVIQSMNDALRVALDTERKIGEVDVAENN
jgi:hypothetical protein